MKREELKNLGLEDYQIEKVMSAYGKDVQDLQKQVTDLASERDSFKSQFEESGKTIQELQEKARGNEEAQKAITEWQKQAEEAQAALTNTQKNNAIELALRDAGALNAKAVKALLDEYTINFKDGKISGLDEQIKSLREAKDSNFLFESKKPAELEETPKPKITLQGNPNPNNNTDESLDQKILKRLSDK